MEEKNNNRDAIREYSAKHNEEGEAELNKYYVLFALALAVGVANNFLACTLNKKKK